jgi:hypothetical protein
VDAFENWTDRLQTLEHIREFVEDHYDHQHGRLPLMIAQPDWLLLHALLLAGPAGLTRTVLRGVVPVGSQRFGMAIRRLEEADYALHTREPRPDRLGRMRVQVVWRAAPK